MKFNSTIPLLVILMFFSCSLSTNNIDKKSEILELPNEWEIYHDHVNRDNSFNEDIISVKKDFDITKDEVFSLVFTGNKKDILILIEDPTVGINNDRSINQTLADEYRDKISSQKKDYKKISKSIKIQLIRNNNLRGNALMYGYTGETCYINLGILWAQCHMFLFNVNSQVDASVLYKTLWDANYTVGRTIENITSSTSLFGVDNFIGWWYFRLEFNVDNTGSWEVYWTS